MNKLIIVLAIINLAICIFTLNVAGICGWLVALLGYIQIDSHNL
jgi:hypothetical protein